MKKLKKRSQVGGDVTLPNAQEQKENPTIVIEDDDDKSDPTPPKSTDHNVTNLFFNFDQVGDQVNSEKRAKKVVSAIYSYAVNTG